MDVGLRSIPVKATTEAHGSEDRSGGEVRRRSEGGPEGPHAKDLDAKGSDSRRLDAKGMGAVVLLVVSALTEVACGATTVHAGAEPAAQPPPVLPQPSVPPFPAAEVTEAIAPTIESRRRPPIVLERENSGALLARPEANAVDVESDASWRGALAIEVLAAASTPPGLSPSRATERETQRSERMVALLASLEGRSGRARTNQLEAWLLAPDTPPVLWFAVVDLVRDAELDQFAIDLEWALDEGPDSSRRAAARRALHSTFGLWFDSSQDLAPFARERSRPLRGAYRERLASLEDREMELRRLAWTTADRTLADLGNASPRVRFEAATALARLVRESGSADADLLDPLLEQLAVEPDVDALHGQLEAAQLLVRDLDPSDTRVVRLRELLIAGLQGAPKSTFPSLTGCLAALPLDAADTTTWAPSGRGLVDAVRRRSTALDADVDATIALITALRRMATDLGGEQLAAAFAPAELTDAVLDLAGARRTPEASRRAALAALSDLATSVDLGAVVARLRDRSIDEALRFELLGVVERLATRLAPGDPMAELVARVALENLGADQVDVRRRAASVLEQPDVLEAASGEAAVVLVAIVTNETVPELRTSGLRALERVGGPAELGELLAVEGFPRDAASMEVLAGIAPALAGDNGELLMQTATRIADIGDLRARELAVELVCAVDPVDRVVASGRSDAVCRWALEVLDAGTWESSGRTADAARTLAEAIVPNAGGLSDIESARLRGLLAHAADAGPEVIEQELALALLLAEGDVAERRRVLRTRARVRLELGDPRGGFEDWMELAAEPADGSRQALSRDDLRRAFEAGELAAVSVSEPGLRRALAERAILLGFDLFGREEWGLDAVAQRWTEVERQVSVISLAADREAAKELLSLLDEEGGALADLVRRDELRGQVARARLTLEAIGAELSIEDEGVGQGG